MPLNLKEQFLPQPPSFQKKKAYEIHDVLGTGTFGKVMVRLFLPPIDIQANIYFFAFAFTSPTLYGVRIPYKRPREHTICFIAIASA